MCLWSVGTVHLVGLVLSIGDEDVAQSEGEAWVQDVCWGALHDLLMERYAWMFVGGLEVDQCRQHTQEQSEEEMTRWF